MNDPTVNTATDVTFDYYFRTQKDSGYKRPSLSINAKVPNAFGIIELLHSEDDKVVSLITDTVQGIISNHIKGYVDNDLEFSQEALDALVAEGKVSLEHIAHIPKADRNVMSKEDLEQFATDYLTFMPEITGKDKARVQAAASLFVERFKRATGDNQVLQILQEQLNVFVEGVDAEVIERNEKVITWAAAKLEELLSIKITADAL